jgi:acetylornithine/N-succinyldiaminopimelate aminotransferase
VTIIDDFHRHMAQTTPSHKDLVVSAGHGVTLTGDDGATYLDLTSGIAVANVGHAHPAVAAAVTEAVGRLTHVNVYGRYIVPEQVELVRRLCTVTPQGIDVLFPTNSGAEAIDGAIKLCRLATGKPGIVAFEGDFHGRSLGSLSVTWKPEYREPFEPLLPGVTFVPPFDAAAARAVLASGDVGCVIVEPVQGEAGVRPAPPGFLAELRAACDEFGALLVVDEVQGGFGRAGRWFSFERYDGPDGNAFVPDVIVMAKAMGGGLPLGGFMARADIMRAFSDRPLSHLTTFGGNPVCCAAASAAFDVIVGEGLVERSDRLGDQLGGWLTELVEADIGATAVRWAGLWAGLDIADPSKTMDIVRRCQAHGVLVGSMLHNAVTIRFAPPLIISEADLRRGVDVVAESIREVLGS